MEKIGTKAASSCNICAKLYDRKIKMINERTDIIDYFDMMIEELYSE